MAKRKKRRRPRNRDLWNIGEWKQHCDALWRELILLRAGHCCEICGIVRRADGQLRQLHAHHLIDREVLVYRHEPMNGICLCAQCHNGDKHTAAHRNPRVFMSTETDQGSADPWGRFPVRFPVGTHKDVLRYNWWHGNYRTGPEQDKFKPKLRDYPGIAAGLTVAIVAIKELTKCPL